MKDRLGVFMYLGMTQTKKTTKAYADLADDVAATGWPALVLDCMPAWNFEHERHVDTPEAVLDSLYGQGRHTFFTPRSTDDIDWILRGIRAKRPDGSKLGKIHILWDECSIQMSKWKITDEISQTLRGWAHYSLTFRLVTQRPGDLHGDVFGCNPEAYVHRVRKAGDLDRLREEFNLDPEKVKALPDGEFITVPRGAV
jgi:hypothetical protein